jgi:hypothetical protein
VPPSAVNLLAVTGDNRLLRFNSTTPGTIESSTPITGLQAGETIRGLDVRPATGQLYALGSTSRLYAIDPATAAAAPVGAGPFAVPLSGASFGFAFDPVADRIRVVSDAGQNLRLNPDTGAVFDADPNAPGTQPDAFLTSTYIVGSAYTNTVPGATASTLYAIDGANDWLVRLGGPNGNPSPDQGQVTAVGPLGVDSDWAPVPTAAFDITAADGSAFAALRVGGRTSLYTIDLATGKATAVGPIAAGSVVGLAAAPLLQASSVAVNGGTAQRSRVTELTVSFNGPATLPTNPAAAFRLTRTGPVGPTGDVALAVDLSASTAARTVARLTFSGPLTESGSLLEGIYRLTVLSAQVSAGGVALDGDGNGTPGGDFATPLHRLYGDCDGDGRVDNADFFMFRSTFGRSAGDPLYMSFLDINGDGRVDNADFIQFRTRFGIAPP